eukprot:1194053-Karenia_brevis.AAC.1
MDVVQERFTELDTLKSKVVDLHQRSEEHEERIAALGKNSQMMPDAPFLRVGQKVLVKGLQSQKGLN